MSLTINPTEAACGARITGLDLRAPLTTQHIAEIEAAWHSHHVLVFPNQTLSDADLESFTLAFGPFGENPYIAPLTGRENIIPVKRNKDEAGPIFAGSWHTDWSFMPAPPLGTCLYAKIIPPEGGDTVFANQHLALARMPPELRAKLDGKHAIHSGRASYAPGGTYSKMDPALAGMTITPSPEAEATQTHPLIKAHPQTGRFAIYGTAGHIVGIDGMTESESKSLLEELHRWQTRPEFQYRHKWQPNMLVMWNNHALIHMATGGYEGHQRLLHRTMIGAG